MINLIFPHIKFCIKKDKSKIFLASANGSVQVLDLATQKFMEVTKHSEPVSFCYQASIGPMSCLISASWDKTIRFTDLRQTASPFTINLDQKVLKADIVIFNFALISLWIRYFVTNTTAYYKLLTNKGPVMNALSLHAYLWNLWKVP